MKVLLRLGAVAIATSAFTVGGLAGTANAQPVAVGNLVNVQITNVLNNDEIAAQIPITAAANICDVDAVVLATDVSDGGATCTARSGNQLLTITQ